MATVDEAPTFDDAARAEILLALTPDVGPILRTRLLERFETAEAIFAASESALQGKYWYHNASKTRLSAQSR